MSRCAGGAPAGWWQTEERRLSVQVERRGSREPSSSLLLALTDPLQKREERRMKPYSFLFSLDDTTEEERLSLSSLSRDAFTCTPETPPALRCACWASDDAFCQTPTGGQQTQHPFYITERFTFQMISVFVLKSDFEILKKKFAQENVAVNEVNNNDQLCCYNNLNKKKTVTVSRYTSP